MPPRLLLVGWRRMGVGWLFFWLLLRQFLSNIFGIRRKRMEKKQHQELQQQHESFSKVDEDSPEAMEDSVISDFEDMSDDDQEEEMSDHDQDQEMLDHDQEEEQCAEPVTGTEVAVAEKTDGKMLKDIFEILIPGDITRLIFNRLDTEEREEARLVSKRWAELIDSTLKWKPYLYDHGIKELKRFIRKGYPIDELNVSKLQGFVYPESGMGFVKVRAIHFLPFKDRGEKKYRGISSDNLRNMMLELKNVEEIHLHSMALNEADKLSFQSMDLPMLKSLEISTLDTDGPGFDVCLKAIDNTYPSLVQLRASIFFDVDGELIELPPYYKNIFQFCVRHKETLRDFHVDFNTGGYVEPMAADLTEDLEMSAEEFLQLKTELTSVRLDKFVMAPTVYEGQNRFTLACTLLESQKYLTVLKIPNLHRCNKTMWTHVKAAISQCSSTLTTIVIQGCFCPSDGIMEHYSCTALHSCRNLKDLQLSVCGLIVGDIQHIPRQSLQILDLNLDRDQLAFVADGHFKELRKLIIRPKKSEADSPIPAMTFTQFLKILKNLPALTNLVMYTKATEWKKVKKFSVRNIGLVVTKCPEEMEIGPKYQMITINRSMFQYNFES
ncbi:uncharacterized protein LOC110849198 [Folsomia candida]|uniref:F-box domain-containing protein n=1 Tax=Folsomia candida TaxID=158441 RepID=A0A226ECZ6_FOLCA|nr:uncharacterized protein LOC110849198 [Folsomia candida]OXA55473.1 hypothetical protein Fcan01_09678 [Folsomia candida]